LIVNTLGSINVRVSFAGSVADAAQLAQTSDCDLVIASLDTKNEDALQICPQLRTQEATRQMPILLLASESDIARVATGLDLGATDYILRPLDANELLARTRTQLRQKRHYQLLRRSFERTLTMALVDPLTGAFNRRYLEAHMPNLIVRCRAADKPLSVLMIDIDHFKQINDKFLHANGDLVLKEIVNRIMLGLRPSDLVARMGGEEFAVMMPEAGPEMAMMIAERLRERIAATPIVLADGRSLTATVSVGIASMMPDRNEDPKAVFKRADTALYEAKKAGRNRVVCEGAENG